MQLDTENGEGSREDCLGLRLWPYMSLAAAALAVKASTSKNPGGEQLYKGFQVIHETAQAGHLGHNSGFYSEVCSIRAENMAQLLQSH